MFLLKCINLLKTTCLGYFFMFFSYVYKEAIYMMLDEYKIENTKIKFYDDCIVADTVIQKEYIDNAIINLIKNLL